MRLAGVFACLLLPACAQLETAKAVLPTVADTAVDKAYALTCGLPYKTEQRFLARNDIDATAHKMFCKRRLP